MKLTNAFFTICFSLLFPLGYAHATSSQIPLPVEQVFQTTASISDKAISIHWNILPGYYLYRERTTLALKKGQWEAELEDLHLPPGIPRTDEFFGEHQVYASAVTLSIPYQKVSSSEVELLLTYQGCAEHFCYPPVEKSIVISMDPSPAIKIQNPVYDNLPPLQPAQHKSLQILLQNNIGLIMGSFFLFGLFLSFTPCVLPMIPILSGMIVGQQNISGQRAFFLSLAYVVGMSITYAIAGSIAGLFGQRLESALQTPRIMIAFSTFFIFIALSLFNIFHVRLPTGLQTHITKITHAIPTSSYFGIALLGAFSVLIVSPCITPPLVGALTYIGLTGNAYTGALALLMMGLGMGVLLLLVGTLGGQYLPKRGPWMHTIRILFGFIFLGMALWLLQRILPYTITSILWAILFFSIAYFLIRHAHTFNRYWRFLLRLFGLLLFVYAIFIVFGTALDNKNPLQPTLFLKQNDTKKAPFIPIKTISDLQHQLELARIQNKPIMLDFYADWCIACKKMEENTFTHPTLLLLLEPIVLLRADVTKNDKADKALMKYLSVIAPPTLVFFKPNHTKPALQLVGEISAETLIQYIKADDKREEKHPNG